MEELKGYVMLVSFVTVVLMCVGSLELDIQGAIVMEVWPVTQYIVSVFNRQINLDLSSFPLKSICLFNNSYNLAGFWGNSHV